MPIYKNGQSCKVFKGDSKPVNIYKGNVKVAGWQFSDVSGEILSVNNTYNDTAKITINGKTIEIGTGTKSPSNPYTLNSVSNFDVVSSGKNLFDKNNLSVINARFSGDGSDAMTSDVNFDISSYIPLKPLTAYFKKSFGASVFALYNSSKVFVRTVLTDNGTFTTATNEVYVRLSIAKANADIAQLELGSIATSYTPFRGLSTANFPYTLRSLPDGTKDYIEIDNINKTAKLYRYIGEKIFNGTDSFSAYTTLTNTISRSIVISDAKKLSYNDNETRSNRLVRISNVGADVEGYGNGDTTNRLLFRLNKSRIGYQDGWTSLQISAAVNAYFSSNNWVLLYKLATPVITDLPYADVLTYYPQTQVFTNAAVQPLLEGRFRIIGN